MDSRKPRQPRYSVRIAVKIADLLSGRTISGETSNVSLAGCYVHTDHQLDIKAGIRIEFAHMGTSAILYGEVVRADPGRGVGIRFRAVSSDQVAELKKWLFRS
jgi:hypothetical protein